MKIDRHKVKQCIYSLHLYTSKPEALFKTSILLMSCAGAFWSNVSETAYYLFSIAIIMEYTVQLVRAKELEPKLLPFLLLGMNFIILFIATGQLLFRKTETFAVQFVLVVLTMVIIVIDTAATLMIEKPDDFNPEHRIKEAQLPKNGL